MSEKMFPNKILDTQHHQALLDFYNKQDDVSQHLFLELVEACSNGKLPDYFKLWRKILVLANPQIPLEDMEHAFQTCQANVAAKSLQLQPISIYDFSTFINMATEHVKSKRHRDDN